MTKSTNADSNSIPTGLTDAEVAARIQRGQVNSSTTQTTSIGSIIRKHTLTLFNLINLILASLIFFVQSYKNALFFFVAIINAGIGIFNEIRAKKIVDQLSLVSSDQQTVIRNGRPTRIPNHQIVLDDIIKYSLGSQIVVDSELVSGQIEVNESFITGESDNITKHPGDHLISGSFVVSGTAYARVTAVGNQNFTSSVLSSAKTIKSAPSKLLSTLNSIIKYVSFALIPIGILLLIKQLNVPGNDPQTAVTSTVAALVGMIPEGLILLTSSVLALSTIRLSKRRVLVQDLYAIETLARVDTICLDKTGTITTGRMSVTDLIPLDHHTDTELTHALELITGNLQDNNATAQALHRKFGRHSVATADELIPFSSDRKYSGVRIGRTTYLIGALEYLIPNSPHQSQANQLSHEHRVLAVVKRTTSDTLLGFVLLQDIIRPDAGRIIQYFYDNDVAVNVISGDNPATITGIATQVGISDPHTVDLSTISKPNYRQLVKQYNIFARVKPEQKKHLVLALKRSGHTVAMTGDGVNDVLAMREADCSISIGEGTDAARQVSKLVLLDSDFGAIPNVIGEGRRTINNLERSATLFLSKTCYSCLLAFIFIFINLRYPFSPIEMTLLNFLTIGAPAFLLALEPNHERVQNRFTRNIIRYSIPTGLTVACSVIALAAVTYFCGLSHTQATSISALVVFTIGIILIIRISRPLNWLRIALVFALVFIMLGTFFIPFIRSTIFSLELLTPTSLIATAGLIAFASILMFIFTRIANHVAKRL